MKTPFHLFPWNKPFLPALKDFAAQLSDNKPGRTLIITPHLRPARYMTNLYRKEKKARILPKMLSINELVSGWRGAVNDEPLYMTNSLDQVAILHECIKELDLNNTWASSLTSSIDNMETFLPWGMRLAKLLEDFAIEGETIKDFPDLSEELGSTPSIILSSLKEINNLWEKKLKERHWTTPGQDHKFVAENAAAIPDIFRPAPDRPVIIAGFYILTGTHDKMLKSLWDAGAHVCLHSDPALLDGKEHWAASRHGKWIRDWAAPIELMEGEVENASEKNKYSFFAGYDLHSQLTEMRSLLQNQGKDGLSTAIIPCQEDALAPLLQNLPPVNVNISMGYPMERSPLVGLLQNILQMFANSPKDSYWRSGDVLAVIRHPYMHMLKEENKATNKGYSSSLFELEKEVLGSGPFWTMEKDDGPAKAFISFLQQTFSDMDSLEKMGQALESFCQWLLGKGKDNWRWKNPVDMEVMHRIVHNMVPVFRNNLLKNEFFSRQTLLDFFNELVKEEKIPFQAEPIEGLQILGMLESRLLHFDRVLFLDATDEAMPASGGQDPLLPDSLRVLVGLPDKGIKEASAAHNLFRLIAGASKVHFLWQEGVPGGEFYDSKRNRSRFVERLIWEQEKDNPNLLDERSGLVSRPLAGLNIKKAEGQPIKRSPEFDAALDRFWSQTVPVTSLDLYMQDPAAFILEKVMALRDKYSVQNRYGLAGTFVHEIMKDLYGNQPNGRLLENIDKDERAILIEKAFNKIADVKKLNRLASVEDQEALGISVPQMLQNYFNNGTDRSRCLAVEEDLEGEIDLGERKLSLQGRMDRLDLGSDGLYVIDYKTSQKAVKNDPSFWEDAAYFAAIQKACQDRDIEKLDELFEFMRKKVGSLQLPLYLLLLAGKSKDKYNAFPANALWAQLALKQKEVPLLASPLSGREDPRLEHFVQALNLVYHHMLLKPEFILEQD